MATARRMAWINCLELEWSEVGVAYAQILVSAGSSASSLYIAKCQINISSHIITLRSPGALKT
jgi:hypothetical protein